jgi:hypothetical protein
MPRGAVPSGPLIMPKRKAPVGASWHVRDRTRRPVLILSLLS